MINDYYIIAQSQVKSVAQNPARYAARYHIGKQWSLIGPFEKRRSAERAMTEFLAHNPYAINAEIKSAVELVENWKHNGGYGSWRAAHDDHQLLFIAQMNSLVNKMEKAITPA